MYSNRTEILGMALDREDNETKALAPISKITMVTAIDFYAGKLHVILLHKHEVYGPQYNVARYCCFILAEEDFIFWVDGQDRTISRIKRDLTDRQMLVKSSIYGVEGLAVDWIAGAIF